jgi:hypothetical protein
MIKKMKRLQKLHVSDRSDDELVQLDALLESVLTYEGIDDDTKKAHARHMRPRTRKCAGTHASTHTETHTDIDASTHRWKSCMLTATLV